MMMTDQQKKNSNITKDSRTPRVLSFWIQRHNVMSKELRFPKEIKQMIMEYIYLSKQTSFHDIYHSKTIGLYNFKNCLQNYNNNNGVPSLYLMDCEHKNQNSNENKSKNGNNKNNRNNKNETQMNDCAYILPNAYFNLKTCIVLSKYPLQICEIKSSNEIDQLLRIPPKIVKGFAIKILESGTINELGFEFGVTINHPSEFFLNLNDPTNENNETNQNNECKFLWHYPKNISLKYEIWQIFNQQFIYGNMVIHDKAFPMTNDLKKNDTIAIMIDENGSFMYFINNILMSVICETRNQYFKHPFKPIPFNQDLYAIINLSDFSQKIKICNLYDIGPLQI